MDESEGGQVVPPHIVEALERHRREGRLVVGPFAAVDFGEPVGTITAGPILPGLKDDEADAKTLSAFRLPRSLVMEVGKTYCNLYGDKFSR